MRVTRERNDHLTREVTEKEIAAAVFAINQEKSLESVGMNA